MLYGMAQEGRQPAGWTGELSVARSGVTLAVARIASGAAPPLEEWL